MTILTIDDVKIIGIIVNLSLKLLSDSNIVLAHAKLKLHCIEDVAINFQLRTNHKINVPPPAQCPIILAAKIYERGQIPQL